MSTLDQQWSAKPVQQHDANHNIYVPDHMSIWTVHVRSEPYTYTRTVGPYASGQTVWVYAYGPVWADHTCNGLNWLNLNKSLSQSQFCVLQFFIITDRWIKWIKEQLKINICSIVYLNPILVLSPKVTLATTSNVIFSTFTCLQFMHVPLHLHIS